MPPTLRPRARQRSLSWATVTPGAGVERRFLRGDVTKTTASSSSSDSSSSEITIWRRLRLLSVRVACAAVGAEGHVVESRPPRLDGRLRLGRRLFLVVATEFQDVAIRLGGLVALRGELFGGARGADLHVIVSHD